MVLHGGISYGLSIGAVLIIAALIQLKVGTSIFYKGFLETIPVRKDVEEEKLSFYISVIFQITLGGILVFVSLLASFFNIGS